MKIRQRLLITFTGVAITVLIIFGSISYQIAGDSSINEQVNLLNIFTIKTATSLSKTLKTIEQKNIPAFLTRREMHIRYPGILLSEKNELIQTDTDEDQPSRQKVLEHIKRHGFQGNHKGYLNGAQDKILWALATVAGTPYKLLMLHNTANTDSFFKTVGIKLLVAGFIVIWLAIWGALILSAWVSNRLDKQNAMMIHHALHDHLTDMPNRYLLFDRLQQAIYYYRRENQPVTLLLLNLKHFKEINDTLGHRSGDSLLKQIGPRLEGIFWEPDTIARLDGDEFAVLLPKVGMSNLNIVIRKLMKAMELPFPIDELMIEAGITIGISIFPDTGEDPDALIRQADVALWEANRHGCEYMIYSPETDPYSVDQLTLMSDLKQAIQDNMLELYYQAKIDIRTRRVIGVESLLRWHHPERGFVSPEYFIPKAEQSGLIKPITIWVLDKALKQYKEWSRKGIDIRIAINVSQRSLYDQHLVDQVIAQMKSLGLKTCKLDMEITETAIMSNPEHALTTLNALHDMGIKLSIDDFGTGFTSLSHLKELPVDELKIDKSFVMNMIKDNKDLRIVSTIIELAHTMGMSVVAEGVETEKVLNILTSLDCDTAQGYYISKPVPAVDFEHWLNTSEWKLH